MGDSDGDDNDMTDQFGLDEVNGLQTGAGAMQRHTATADDQRHEVIPQVQPYTHNDGQNVNEFQVAPDDQPPDGNDGLHRQIVIDAAGPQHRARALVDVNAGEVNPLANIAAYALVELAAAGRQQLAILGANIAGERHNDPPPHDDQQRHPQLLAQQWRHDVNHHHRLPIMEPQPYNAQHHKLRQIDEQIPNVEQHSHRPNDNQQRRLTVRQQRQQQRVPLNDQQRQHPRAGPSDQNDGHDQLRPRLPPLDITFASPLARAAMDPNELNDRRDNMIIVPAARPIWYDYEFFRLYMRRINFWKQLHAFCRREAIGNVQLRSRADLDTLRLHCDTYMLRHQREYCDDVQNDAPIQQILVQPIGIVSDNRNTIIEFELAQPFEIRYISINTKRPYHFDQAMQRWTELAAQRINPGPILQEPFWDLREHLVQYLDDIRPPPLAHPAQGSRYEQISGHHTQESFYVSIRNCCEPLRQPTADGSNDDDLQPYIIEEARKQAGIVDQPTSAPIIDQQDQVPGRPLTQQQLQQQRPVRLRSTQLDHEQQQQEFDQVEARLPDAMAQPVLLPVVQPTPATPAPSMLDTLLAKGRVPDIGLKKYDGVSTTIPLDDWIEMFELRLADFLQTTSTTDRIRLLPLYVEGAAATWLLSYFKTLPKKTCTWSEVTTAMIKEFTNESYLFEKFRRLAPQKDEGYHYYARRLQSAATRAIPDASVRLRDKMIIETMLKHLPATLAQDVQQFIDLRDDAPFDKIVDYMSTRQLRQRESSTTVPKPVATAALASTTENTTYVQHPAASQHAFHVYYAPHPPAPQQPAPPTTTYRHQQQHQQQSQRGQTNQWGNGGHFQATTPEVPTTSQISFSPITLYKYDSLQQQAIPVGVHSMQCRECSEWGHIRIHCPRRPACVTCGRTPGHGSFRCPLLYTHDVNATRDAAHREWNRLQQQAPPSRWEVRDVGSAKATDPNICAVASSDPGGLYGKVVWSQSPSNHGSICGKVVASPASGVSSAPVRPGFANNIAPRQPPPSKPRRTQRSKKRQFKSTKIRTDSSTSHQLIDDSSQMDPQPIIEFPDSSASNTSSDDERTIIHQPVEIVQPSTMPKHANNQPRIRRPSTHTQLLDNNVDSSASEAKTSDVVSQ